MPFRSEAQRRAMYAAAEGRSTIGIPQEAAQHFIAHSEGEPIVRKRHKKRKHDCPLARAKAMMAEG